MLIFDNEGWARDGAKLSRAPELDPLTQEVKWSYTRPPHSSIVEGQERVATIFEMVRLPRPRVAALVSERE